MPVFESNAFSNPGIRMGAGPPTGQYYVSLAGGRGMSPDGWHWGILEGRVPETVKIKGPLVPGQRVQFKRLWKDTSIQWAIFRSQRPMSQHSAGGMPGPGMVGFDAYSMHPGVRVIVPPVPVPNPVKFQPSQYSFSSPHDEEYGFIPFVATGVVGIGATALLLWWLVPTLVVAPALIKVVKPEWSYKRRVTAGTGIVLIASYIRDLVKDEDEGDL